MKPFHRLLHKFDHRYFYPELQCIPGTPEKFLSIKNKYQGERCILLGTAPSINEIDLAGLGDEHVFSANGGYRLLGSGIASMRGFCIADPEAYRDYGEKVDIAKVENLFLHSTVLCSNSELLNRALVYDSYRRPKLHQRYFQFDLASPVFDSHTVMLHLLQIVVYMGFREIYLGGVDLSFSKTDGHFYASSAREKKSFARSQKNTRKMLKGFYVASKLLKERGINLYRMVDAGSLSFLDVRNPVQ